MDYKNNKKIIKIIISILIISALLFYFFMPLLLAAFFGNDQESVDDNDLIFYADRVSDEENIYYDLEELREKIELPENLKLREFLESSQWEDREVEELLNKNQSVFSGLDLASTKEFYANPAFTGQEPAEVFSIEHWTNAAYLSGVKAINLAKAGKGEPALKEAVKTLKIGSVIMRADISITEYLGAVSFQKTGLDAIRVIIPMIDHDPEYLADFGLLLKQYKTASNGSFLKFEYNMDKLIIEAMAAGNTPAELPQSLAKSLNNGFYFKKNQTINDRAEHYRAQLSNFLGACGGAETASQPSKVYNDSFAARLSSYFTPNAAGKIFNQASMFGFEDLKNKRCDLELRFSATESLLAQTK